MEAGASADPGAALPSGAGRWRKLGVRVLVSLVVGVFVSLIQTVTSVQEMTLTFVPKLIGVALIIVVAGSWMLAELTSWVIRLWTSIPQIT